MLSETQPPQSIIHGHHAVRNLSRNHLHLYPTHSPPRDLCQDLTNTLLDRPSIAPRSNHTSHPPERAYTLSLPRPLLHNQFPNPLRRQRRCKTRRHSRRVRHTSRGPSRKFHTQPTTPSTPKHLSNRHRARTCTLVRRRTSKPKSTGAECGHGDRLLACKLTRWAADHGGTDPES